MERKIRYVNLQMNEVRDQSIPGNIEYEIFANNKEVNEINLLFKSLDHDSKQALSYIVNFFDEGPVDTIREEYGTHLVEIYKLIYKLGTEETKSSISKLNL